MKLKDRIKALANLHREDILSGDLDTFVAEVEDLFKDQKSCHRLERKPVELPYRINNPGKYMIIRETQDRSKEYWGIDRKTSGIVITEAFGIMRRAIRHDTFNLYAKELYRICAISQQEEILKKTSEKVDA